LPAGQVKRTGLPCQPSSKLQVTRHVSPASRLPQLSVTNCSLVLTSTAHLKLCAVVVAVIVAKPRDEVTPITGAVVPSSVVSMFMVASNEPGTVRLHIVVDVTATVPAVVALIAAVTVSVIVKVDR